MPVPQVEEMDVLKAEVESLVKHLDAGHAFWLRIIMFLLAYV